MKIENKKLEFPKINFKGLDLTRMVVSVAGVLKNHVKRNMNAGNVGPPLKASTIKAKQKHSLLSVSASTPLVDSGLLRDSVSSRKVGINHAEVYVEKRRYSQFAKNLGASSSKSAWSKKKTVGGDTKAGNKVSLVDTVFVGKIHTSGAGSLPVRQFMLIWKSSLKPIRFRIQQGVRGALKRSGIVK